MKKGRPERVLRLLFGATRLETSPFGWMNDYGGDGLLLGGGNIK